MPRRGTNRIGYAFILKIQRELLFHFKCARKVSGLSRNGLLSILSAVLQEPFLCKMRMRPSRCFILEADNRVYHVDKKMRTMLNIIRNWYNIPIEGDIASRKKGICHIWSRGRHFSPSLPDALVLHRYLKTSVQSDLRAEISGSIVKVQRSGASSRGTAAGSHFHCLIFAFDEQVTKCLPDTKCKQKPNHVTLNKVLSLLGTDYHVIVTKCFPYIKYNWAGPYHNSTK